MELRNIMDDTVSWSMTHIQSAATSFAVTRRFFFTMASPAADASEVTTRCAWPGQGEPFIELMPLMNFLVHSYTCCSDRHASPYWTFIRRWISMGFTYSLRCFSLVHVASGAPTLHYYCVVVLYFCIILPPFGHSSNHEYHCCQLTRQLSCDTFVTDDTMPRIWRWTYHQLELICIFLLQCVRKVAVHL
jgi:hypothetical protein